MTVEGCYHLISSPDTKFTICNIVDKDAIIATKRHQAQVQTGSRQHFKLTSHQLAGGVSEPEEIAEAVGDDREGSGEDGSNGAGPWYDV